MPKRPFLKLKPIRNRATNEAEIRVQRHMLIGKDTVSIVDRVGNFTQFCELGVALAAYLLGMIKWGVLEPIVAKNLTKTQCRIVASSARTLAMNLEINEHLEMEKTK